MAPSTTSTSTNLCTKGCGFFSGSGLQGLCSLCYKEEVKKSGRLEDCLSSVPEQKQTLGGKQDNATEEVCRARNQPEVVKDVDDQEDEKEKEVMKAPLGHKRAPKTRCESCRRKLGLLGFSCRCGGQFCSLHRHSSEHECGFDWKELGRSEVARNNPLVRGQKVVKI